jgi:ATP-dependent DNA helicase RecQ
VGSGEMEYFDFDLQEFVKNFQLDTYLVNNTLKILEQEGHCQLSENLFLPSRTQFTVDKDSLYAFELSYPELEPLVKTLLRTYQGIYDNRTPIFEKQLSRILRKPIESIKEQLTKLHQLGILEYLPQKEKPQIYFLLNRAPAEYLHIDQDHYLKRKKQYQKRLDAMMDYIQTSNKCRSNLITAYFGETTVKFCGNCDNCLKRKKTTLQLKDFQLIADTIKQLAVKGTTINEVLLLGDSFTIEDLWEVLRFLESEQIIHIEENGKLSIL